MGKLAMYQVLHRAVKNDNTAEYGFGDCPKETWRAGMEFFAASEDDAKRRMKKILPSLRFGGRFPNARIEKL